MRNIVRMLRLSSKTAHRLGVFLGILLGVLSFGSGMVACFSAVTQTPRQGFFMVIGTLAMFSVLPLSVLAITKPRTAGRGIAVAWLAFNIAFFGSMPWKQLLVGGLAGFAYVAVWFFALPLTVVALLHRASPAMTPASTQSAEEAVPDQPMETTHGRVGAEAGSERGNTLDQESRKRLAKWVALVVGVAIGLWRLRSAKYLVVLAVRSHSLATLGFAAPVLAAIPLAALGLWKPRWAAYGFATCFLILLASPLRAAHSLGDVLGYLLFMGIPALPFALVAVLFFYASWRRVAHV
jgi:MFS family permease